MVIKPKKKILVVEDNPEIVKVYKLRLANANYEVDVAFDGKEALEMVKDRSYDCILLDVILLGRASGKEIAPQLKAVPHLARTPIIFLTNTIPLEKDKGSETIDIGSDRFRAFAKPIHWPKLISVIRKEINRSLYNPGAENPARQMSPS